MEDGAPELAPPADRGTGPVAVVGAGWAGCAAAVTLAQAGIAVTLFEQAKTPGGRARRVAVDGRTLDNGQHLLIGAYRQTLALMATVHGVAAPASLFRRLPLTLAPFAPGEGVALAARRLPAPLHLVAAFAGARGLSWPERFGLAAGFRRLAAADFRCPPGQTVGECFAAAPPRAMAALWTPLCIAALNTPPERASAQMFANVLRATLTRGAADSDFLVPATDLSTLVPDAALRFVAGAGGTVRTGVTVRGVSADADAGGVRVDAAGRDERFAAAVVAVGPHQLAATVGGDGDAPWRPALDAVGAFGYESITTVYLEYAGPVPLPAPIARLDDAPGQWVFGRAAAESKMKEPDGASTRLAVVISANGPHDALDHAMLARVVDAQLRRLRPALPALTWAKVIAERRATYACTPALRRPAAGRVAAGLYLAGDYTDPEFPATLEAAARSGVQAARALLADAAAPGP